MLIKIKYYGLITNNLISEVSLPEGSKIGDLLEYLIKEEAKNEDIMKKATILVNKLKADPNTLLNDKDEVMILTILGGG